MIKTINKLRIEGNFLNLIKDIIIVNVLQRNRINKI